MAQETGTRGSSRVLPETKRRPFKTGSPQAQTWVCILHRLAVQGLTHITGEGSSPYLPCMPAGKYLRQ